MRPDRVVALFLLAFCLGYAVLAWNYPLLPFELQTSFKPNTMPLALAVSGVFLSFAVLVFPGSVSGLSDDAKGWHGFDWRAVVGIIVLMLLYATTIRSLGYLLSTTLFLMLGAALLGERNFRVLIPVTAFTAFLTWYLVHKVLGVYLKPLPVFWG